MEEASDHHNKEDQRINHSKQDLFKKDLKNKITQRGPKHQDQSTTIDNNSLEIKEVVKGELLGRLL